MNLFKCLSCGANLPDMSTGESTCEHCATVNILDRKEGNQISHRADGQIPVEIPTIIALGLFLGSMDDLFVCSDPAPGGSYWGMEIPDNTMTLGLGEFRKWWFLGIKQWATLKIPKDKLVVIEVDQFDIDRAKELGVKIEESLGLPVKIHVASAKQEYSNSTVRATLQGVDEKIA